MKVWFSQNVFASSVHVHEELSASLERVELHRDDFSCTEMTYLILSLPRLQKID